ncbi:hypothetical protein Hanom_Chr16g01426551 [Helianthus anomalus]
MSYEGGYPTVLKKLFPPCWRLLVHFFLHCIIENKGGFDQLKKTQTSAIVALVNGGDFNFSAFIFDNMKKMLEDPKKIFMLYPNRWGRDALRTLVETRENHHNFEGRFALEKHGRFADVVQARKKQRTDSAPDHILSGSSTAPESTPIIDSQPGSQREDASKKINTEDPDLSSGGVRFEAGSSSRGDATEHDEASFSYAAEKRQMLESDSDNVEHDNVERLKRHVVVLEQDVELKNAEIVSLQQDAALKEAQISSLQSQLTNRDLTINQLQGDVGMLMSIVYDLKAKLDKKFGNEFVDKEDEQFYVGRTEQTPEQRATAHAASQAECAAALEAYLAAKPKKRSSKSKKRQE